LEKFVFRTATPYIDVPAGVELDIAIAPANSNSVADAIANFPVTLDAGGSYIAIANGIVGGNPGFNLELFDMGRETAPDGQVGLLFFHGSPDAPTVDILANGGVLYDNISYGEFASYANVPAAAYEISVTPGDDNSNIVASYEADFGFWKRKTAVVFASGFLGGNDPSFEPWVALSTGGTFPLKQLTTLKPNSDPATAKASILNISPNPASTVVNTGIEILAKTNTVITITNAQGFPVERRDLGVLNEGVYFYEFDTNNYVPGFYNIHIQTDRQMISKRITVVR